MSAGTTDRNTESDDGGLPFLWRCVLWFGILTGLGQALVVTLVSASTKRLVQITPEVWWMAPIANIGWYSGAALVAYVVTRRLIRSWAVASTCGVFVFFALAGPALLVPRLYPYATVVFAAGVAVQVARFAHPRAARVQGLIRRTLPWVVALGLVLGVGQPVSREILARKAEASLREAVPGGPNVLLIVLDTVRASNLSLYGYGRQTSPYLEAFGRAGVVFDRALSTSSWTLPAHSTMFTGRLPHEVSADWLTPLDAAHPTLAERLSQRGYVTVGFAANLQYTTRATGLDRGFVRYSDFPVAAGTLAHESWLIRPLVEPLREGLGVKENLVRKKGAQVTGEFVSWLESRPQRPFFAFLNYFDAHVPYRPPPPFDRRFGDGGPMPKLDADGQPTGSAQEVQRYMDAYDGALAYLDDQVRQVIEALSSQHVLDNTLVVLTSDHGEQFGENGLFDHANSLYWPALHVPLVLSFPAAVPRNLRVAEPVSLADLPATILSLVSPGGTSSLPGRSLARYWDSSPRTESFAEPLFAEMSQGINMSSVFPASKGRMLSTVLNGVHYIRNGDGTEELYDFEHDASEANNLAARPDLQARLAAARRAVDATLIRR